jgi:type IV secretion system protein VirB4
MESTMSLSTYSSRSRREASVSDHIPYTAHVAEHVAKTIAGDYVQSFRVGGVSFEAADNVDINVRHARLNVLLRTIASPHVAIWTHVIRRHVSVQPAKYSGGGFAQRLHEKYAERVAHDSLMANELYFSVVYRPMAGRTTGLAARMLSKTDRQGAALEQRDSLDHCAHLRQTILQQLSAYDAEALGIVERNGRHYSTLLEFLSLLVDGEPRSVLLPRAPLNQVLGTTRPIFGIEAIEYRLPAATRVAAFLGIKEYATPTIPGMLDPLLSAPFPFVLTQSFACLSRAASQGLLVRQYNQLKNVGDFAVSQAEELRAALDELTAGEWVMGDHHWSLQILAEPVSGISEQDAALRLKPLNDSLAAAANLLVDTQFTFAREDLGLEAAWWSQLPGMFALRPRKAPITSLNFAALSPFHNYPAGRQSGNHWGDAAALLVSTARSPFYFSLHAADPRDPTGELRKDTGHTLILGPTGSGKTVWVAFLLTMLLRFGVTQVVIDKDRGLEILVRALNGTYSPLRNGIPTGFNPLHLPTTPANTEFLRRWLRTLVRPPNRPLSAREEADLDQALRGALALDPSSRRLSRVYEFLDVTDAEGVCARLAPWCEVAGGEDAWVFDHASDTAIPRLASQALLGFDVTDFLDNERVRTPITLYLFHLVRSLLGTRRVVCWADEFSRLVNDDAFLGFAKDGLQVWRKLDGVLVAAAQSPSNVLGSPIARTILEQTATKLFMPNVEASREDYVDGCGVTEREFRLIQQELRPGQCLIRQGHQSVVCELDLHGCDEELAVMSGRANTVALTEQLIRQHGENADDWLPSFFSKVQDPGSE